MNEENQTNTQEFNIYCNGVQILMGTYDFTIIINRNSANQSTKLGEIKMSPEHAKVFSNILAQHVEKYEEVFGKIPDMDQDRLKTLQEEGKIRFDGVPNE